jgi:hypothetical protein
VYYNGALQPGAWYSGNGSASPQVDNQEFWLGADNYNGGAPDEGYAGALDEVKIYNRVLTQSEIQRDMNTPIDSPP